MQILIYPNPQLRQKAQPVEEVNGETRAKSMEMLELMYAAKGVGLAAPQVGWLARIVVTDVDGRREGNRVFVNPVLIEESGEEVMEEGCLSFPGITAKIPRAARVKVSAYTLDGEKLEIAAEGIHARAWQHELDHLDGSLIVDRMSTVARLANVRKLRQLGQEFKAAQVEGKSASRKG
jgi:peptide deformylase